MGAAAERIDDQPNDDGRTSGRRRIRASETPAGELRRALPATLRLAILGAFFSRVALGMDGKSNAALRAMPTPRRVLPGLLLLLAGCAMTSTKDSERHFLQRIADTLAQQDTAVVKASDLTDFDWDTLCFERDKKLLLKFSSGGQETVFALPYETHYVAEPYVEKSLAERCVGREDRIVIRKKYPGYQDVIEFQQAD